MSNSEHELHMFYVSMSHAINNCFNQMMDTANSKTDSHEGIGKPIISHMVKRHLTQVMYPTQSSNKKKTKQTKITKLTIGINTRQVAT